MNAQQAPSPDLTEQIAAVTQRIDYLCDDHFSPLTTTIDVDVDATSPRLYLPKRVTAITAIKTRDHLGVLTTQPAGAYRLRSSLDAAGALELFAQDYVDLLEWGPGLSGPDITWSYGWPVGTQTVQISGTIGWTVTPGDIKRATALLVWDHFERESGDVRRASRWARGDLTVERASDSLTGMPEADDLLRPFIRNGEGAGGVLVLIG